MLSKSYLTVFKNYHAKFEIDRTFITCLKKRANSHGYMDGRKDGPTLIIEKLENESKVHAEQLFFIMIVIKTKCLYTHIHILYN